MRAAQRKLGRSACLISSRQDQNRPLSRHKTKRFSCLYKASCALVKGHQYNSPPIGDLLSILERRPERLVLTLNSVEAAREAS